MDTDNNEHSIASIAPLTNVRACSDMVDVLMARDPNLPSMGVLFGPSGFGKTMAAIYVANKHRAYHIQCQSTWTTKAVLHYILQEMGIDEAKNAHQMADQVAEELVRSGRPLIVDEMDYLVEKKAVNVIRDIHEASGAPILLIGESTMPAKLKRWERFDSRILVAKAAEPASRKDADALAKLYAPGISIKKDLMNHLLALAHGSLRRITVNLNKIKDLATDEGYTEIDLACWGDRPLYTGEAPRVKRVA